MSISTHLTDLELLQIEIETLWRTLMRPTGRLLFYSTSRTNRSSQGVAARLGLRPLGWLWQLARLS